MDWITSYWELVQPYVLEQYKQSPKLLAYLQKLVAEFDDHEVWLQELTGIYDLSTAVGIQLDIIGSVLGSDRAGRGDDLYRAELVVWVGTQLSGTPEDVITTVAKVTQSTRVEYLPWYPAKYWLLYDGRGLSAPLLNRVSPAGVQGYPGCFLCDITGTLFTMADNDFILVVGPCEPATSGAILLENGLGVIQTETAETLLLEE